MAGMYRWPKPSTAALRDSEIEAFAIESNLARGVSWPYGEKGPTGNPWHRTAREQQIADWNKTRIFPHRKD
jgi:hypothetical protein